MKEYRTAINEGNKQQGGTKVWIMEGGGGTEGQAEHSQSHQIEPQKGQKQGQIWGTWGWF